METALAILLVIIFAFAFGVVAASVALRKPAIVETKIVEVPLPTVQQWFPIDQKTTAAFIRSEHGRKFIEACRLKIYADYLNACHQPGNAEQNNAAVRGANDIVFFMLSLANEDSISSQSDLAKADNPASDLPTSEFAERRAY